MKILIIYHRVDFDGLFSGAIARKYFTEVEKCEVDCLGWNYGDPIPTEAIQNHDQIVMVDISFPPEEMIKLYNEGKTAWVDHHDSSIKASEKNGYADFPGVRVNGIAACELTWNELYPEVKCPKLIQYIGAYDVWNKEKFDWENETLPIQYALRTKFELKFNKLCNTFNDMITNPKVLSFLISSGKTTLEYLKGTWKSWVKAYGFPVKVAGKYNGIALISPQFGSAMFESVSHEYDIYIVAERKGPDQYSMSMYKEPDRLPEFNCAEYMMKTFRNGGGHVSAAGTTLSLEQFVKLITRSEI